MWYSIAKHGTAAKTSDILAKITNNLDLIYQLLKVSLQFEWIIDESGEHNHY